MISILVISSLRSPPPKGECISSPARRLYGFRRQRRYKKWRRKRRTSPAQRYYITPEGESPQPACKASADHRQNPWRPGPKARRRHQPSRPQGRVNLREYGKAPPGPGPDPDPDPDPDRAERRLNPQAPKGLIYKRRVNPRRHAGLFPRKKAVKK